MTKTQLRLYTIEPGRLDEFVAEWTAGILPLRRRLGFRVTAWTAPEADLFVWVLEYAGEGSFGDADAAYYASPERAALDPDPARLIVAQEARWLEPVTGASDAG